MLVMFVGIFTIITIVGVMTVDAGLWLSERRGAQTDADLPALAGARECMLKLATGGVYIPDVQGSVQRWFDENNGGDSELVASGTSSGCEPQPDGTLCVDVTVRDTTSKTFFSSLFSPIFDRVAGNIGAHARACAGAANNPGSVVPFEVENVGPCFIAGEPDFGAMCELEGSSHSANPRGMLDMQSQADYCSDAGGSGNIEQMIENGATGLCLINDGEPCDPNKGGVQVSPRLISVVLLDTVPSAGNTGYPIVGFAGFYLDGCGPDDLTDPSQLDNNQKKCDVGNPGQQVVYGTFVTLIVAGSGIGPVDQSSTEFGIALVDWEGQPTPAPTAVPTATHGPTATPGGPTATHPAPTATSSQPTPCPTVCNGGGQQCHPYCGTNTPVPTNTPRPPTPTRTPVPTATPRPPTATPVPTRTPKH
jgi:hypothetical protein